MIIIGSGGFAKEVLEIVYRLFPNEDINFYDDVTEGRMPLLYDRFPIITSLKAAADYFKKNSPQFVLGIGNPTARHALYRKFIEIGGIPTAVISPDVMIGSFGNTIDDGVTIMQGVKITNSVHVGKGCLINLNCTIGHDTRIGDFCELSPGVHISGNCQMGDYCSMGTNATLLPGKKLGKNVIVGAGAVVTMDLPDNVKAMGIPARIVTNE
ncbi:MAG TPA: acetyltransferase [Puia sp.]